MTPRGFVWSWSRDGERIGSVTVTFGVGLSWLMLGAYRGEQLVRDGFQLEHTPCRYGGQRPWIVCKWRNRRCLVLYGISSDGHFGCHKCLRLGYASESESPIDRSWRRIRKLEGLLTEAGVRPAGIRMRTYHRILERLERAEDRKDDLSWDGIARLLGELGLSEGLE